MEQDFHGDFQVNVTWFFASFSGVLDWIVLILVWFERSLHSAQVSGQSCQQQNNNRSDYEFYVQSSELTK